MSLRKNCSSRDKTNKIICVPSIDSDQPGHPLSLISVHCALKGKLKTKAFFTWTAKTLITLGGCSDWSEFLLGAHVISLVLLCSRSKSFLRSRLWRFWRTLKVMKDHLGQSDIWIFHYNWWSKQHCVCVYVHTLWYRTPILPLRLSCSSSASSPKNSPIPLYLTLWYISYTINAPAAPPL